MPDPGAPASEEECAIIRAAEDWRDAPTSEAAIMLTAAVDAYRTKRAEELRLK